jgi:maleylacetate reductase
MLNGVYRFPAMESVVFGTPYTEALAQEVDRVEARAVFVLASGTLARSTDLVDRLRQMLGNRFAGLCAKIGAHTPRSDVVAAANMAREAGADLIVTLGGGSVTDAAKMVGLCLGNGVTDPAQLDDYRARIASDGTAQRPAAKPRPGCA